MPDELDGPPDDTGERLPALRDDPLEPTEPTSQLAVRHTGEPPAVRWRRRAVVVRSALPQLARNPVVVGASAAAATVLAQLAVDVVRRAVAAPAPAAPAVLTVTGRVFHHHVVHHVHVLHHVQAVRLPADTIVLRGMPTPPRG
jgi:hypothetical protein